MRKEIEFLTKLTHIESVASIEGMLYDTDFGLRGGKRHRKPYPGILMEKLEGKDLCDRVMMQMNLSGGGFTERSASEVFKNFIVALKEVHERARMVNCDLKTENMVFVSAAPDDYRLKIIDFGIALDLNDSGLVRSDTLRGTSGFFAPETLRSPPGYVYSTATDVWQAGCILYIILHAALPFGNTMQSNLNIKGPYPTASLIHLHPSLSPAAKDLILRMLDKDPVTRITLDGILAHEWIASRSSVSDRDLGPEYRRRIKAWAYRKKLKQVLKDRMFVSQTQKEQISIAVMGAASHEQSLVITPQLFKSLQREFMRITDQKPTREVTEEEFFTVVHTANIPWLAHRQVFRIFDNDDSGTVDYFEFLISLVPFRAEYDTGDLARFYFEIFDLNGDGGITKSEFEWALRMFVMDTDAALIAPPADIDSGRAQSEGSTDSSGSEADSISQHSTFDEIFRAVDTNGDGEISLAEFSSFFSVVNTRSTA